MRRLLLFPFAFFPIFGCTTSVSTTATPEPVANSPTSPPVSSDLATSAMWPSMSAQCDGQTLKVYAAVLQGSDFVTLETGDFFVVDVQGGESGIVLSLEPDESAGTVHYFATFPAPSATATVNIAFHRTAFPSAPSSTTTIPAPFEITSPAPGSLTYGTQLALSITPPPVITAPSMEQMTVAFSGDCLQDANPFPVEFDSSGNASFDTSVLQLVQGSKGCDVHVGVRHEFDGPADPTFMNASTNPVLGLQERVFQTSLVTL